MPGLQGLSAVGVIFCPGAGWQEPAAAHSGGVQISWTPVFITLQYVTVVVVVNFVSHLIFIFPLFFGMVMLLMNLKQRKNNY